ncbi:hypothetical protein [Petroclostridium sp. X23]|uniref:hypothetical protein n=1 Tax=Petroclostridium sp. X23 TaxID=3045146 RepID=UPI0024ACCD9A|nr:hypothetical protein [Petroclostridium sp. X23]WHH58355.1 hypothetical protein QKW49_21535 [Petroclostridium sp. X23]
MKKICFAILVHEKRKVIKDLLSNIKHFCPQSSIVLYNGGDDPDLCNGLGYPVCPTSKKMYWGNLALFILEVMEWLQDIGYDYDYLCTLDSDALFSKKGFEQFIASQMKNADYMGVRAKKYDDTWRPGRQMKKKWHVWRPIFKCPDFYGCFNVGQVFKKTLVERILAFNKIDEIKSNITENSSFALEEILYVTLANVLGGRIKAYPRDVAKHIRYRPYVTKKQLQKKIESNSKCYLVHPVPRNMKNDARVFVRSLVESYSKDKNKKR